MIVTVLLTRRQGNKQKPPRVRGAVKSGIELIQSQMVM
jgi:hypothetical protein